MSDQEIYGKLRGMVRRVTLKGVKDDGQMQTASVEVADGIWRDNVEILQPYGFSSSVPEDGALAIVLAVGGDEGDIIALPVANPSARMGGLKEGEVGLYNQFGDKLVIGSGGTIKLSAGASISIEVDGVTVTISSAGVAMQGGKVTHDGKNVGSTHFHGGVLPGGANTSVPSN